MPNAASRKITRSCRRWRGIRQVIMAACFGFGQLNSPFEPRIAEASEGAESPIELIGTAMISGDTPDCSEDHRILENGELSGRAGGFSAIDATEVPGVFRVLSDRGPDDGATSYQCRSHLIAIHVEPGSKEPVKLQLKATEFLRDSQGRPWLGASTVTSDSTTAGRLDPEGLRSLSDGRYIISDEYGPQLLEFAANGHVDRVWQLPGHLKVQNPSPNRDEENAINSVGRASNKGMEGLAVSHDGKHFVGLMQQSLLQDSVRSPEGKVSGQVCRLVELDRTTGALNEYLYVLDSPSHGTNEILAFGPQQYLVIEKDSLTGTEAVYRKLMLVSVDGATNIAGQNRAFADGIPQDVRPVSKVEFLNFLDPAFGLAGPNMPEKIEGLTWGPNLPDGRRCLIVVIDNDFESAAPSQFWIFAVAT